MKKKAAATTKSRRGTVKDEKDSASYSGYSSRKSIKPATPERSVGRAPRKTAHPVPQDSEKEHRVFQTILQSSSDGILAVDRENKVLFANDRFVQMWMIPDDVLVRKDDTILLRYVLDQLSDPQGFLKKVQELYNSSEESFDALHFKDGRVFERFSRPLVQDTELSGRVWSFRDVTERMQAEKTLAEERYLLRTVIDFSPYEIFMKDRECRYTLVNASQAKVLGITTAAEAVGKTAFDFFPERLAAQFHEDDLSIIETGQPVFDVERLGKDAKGDERWRLVSKAPLQDTNGNIIGVVGIGRDITERKRAEQALQTAEKRYRGLFEDAPAMYVITRETKDNPVIVDCNELFARTIGYRHDEILGQPVADFYSPASRLLLREGGYQRALRGEFGTQERELLTRDGHIIPTMVRAVPEINAMGIVSGTRAMFVDISERKKAEEELRFLKSELERANAELRQAVEREKELACTDGMTGLCNHRYFFELANREFHAALRHWHPLAFFMFDMDDFKRVNDTLGHAAGDNLLFMVAKTAVAQVRASDVVARYGGDEFIVMLPHSTAQQALPVAERIRGAVAAIHPETDGAPFAVTLSVGIADLQREPVDEDVDRVIKRADEALYQAKHRGRNRTVIFGQDS